MYSNKVFSRILKWKIFWFKDYAKTHREPPLNGHKLETDTSHSQGLLEGETIYPTTTNHYAGDWWKGTGFSWKMKISGRDFSSSLPQLTQGFSKKQWLSLLMIHYGGAPPPYSLTILFAGLMNLQDNSTAPIKRDFLKSVAFIPWNMEGYDNIMTHAYF